MFSGNRSSHGSAFRRDLRHEAKVDTLKRITRCWAAPGGDVVPFRHAANAPRSFASAVARRFFGRYPELPFIPYSATAHLERVITPASSIVEVGSGYSTIWLAKRSRKVASLEWRPDWHRTVATELKSRGLEADLRLTTAHDDVHFDWIQDESADVIFIDGGPRSICLENLWPKLRSGGTCYLDNWDVGEFWTEVVDGYEFIKSIAGEIGYQRVLVDYVPGMFCVETGLMIRKA